MGDGAPKKVRKQTSKTSVASKKSEEKKEEPASKADDAKKIAEAKAKAKAEAKAKAKAKARAKSAGKSGCFPCRRSSNAPEKPPPPLTFDQWKKWFTEFCEIPEGLDEDTVAFKSSQPAGVAGQFSALSSRTFPPGGIPNLAAPGGLPNIAAKPWAQQA